MNGNGHRQPSLPTPEQIERMRNPTGAARAMPWHAHDRTRGVYRYAIRDDVGVTVARFDTREARDFALFWANTHVGVIQLLRGFKFGFEFVKGASHGDEALADYAGNQAEIAGIWEEFFTTLGASARRHAETKAGDQP